jgi:hypothetical protein
MYLLIGIVWVGSVVFIGTEIVPEVHPSRWVAAAVIYQVSVTVALAITIACVMAPIMIVCRSIEKKKEVT